MTRMPTLLLCLGLGLLASPGWSAEDAPQLPSTGSPPSVPTGGPGTEVHTAAPSPSPQVPNARELVLIAHSSVPAEDLEGSRVRNVFLGRTSTWSNRESAVVLMRPTSSELSGRFLESFLRMNPASWASHWQNQEMTGRGIAPPTVSSIAELLARVGSTAGAVAYAERGELPDPAPVQVKPLPPK
jgi:hypothetical protein